MKPGTSNLLLYWRNSLVDGSRAQELEYAVEVGREEVESGELGAGRYEQLKAKHREAARAVSERGKDAAAAADGAVPVLVCPYRLFRKHGHYQEASPAEERSLVPLWVPAWIDPDGRLRPREDVLPWIARDMLEPTARRGVTIGDIEDVERFLTETSQEGIWDSWPEYLGYARRMLESMPEGNLNVPGYALAAGSFVMPDVEVRGAALHVIRTLDYLLESGTVPPLLERYAALEDAPERPLLSGKELLRAEMLHTGQINGSFPLSPSQREALLHILAEPPGSITAVNGPPGTGKTVLMHSVAASLWVEAALKQAARPPVIVVASSNNQAVTNMIDSFSRVGVDEAGDPLSRRWLPGVESYGLYCPSGAASQREESEKYQKALPGDAGFPARSGFPSVVETLDYLQEAAQHYLKCFGEYAGIEAISVKSAVDHLHRELVEAVEQLRAELNRAYRRGSALADRDRVLESLREKYGMGSSDDTLRYLESLRAQLESRAAELQRERSALRSEINAAASRLDEVECLALEMSRDRGGPLGRLLSFFKRHSGGSSLPEPLRRSLERQRAALEEAASREASCADEMSRLEARLKELEKDIALAAELDKVIEENGVEPLRSVQERLDVTLRHRAFLLAARYWEGRWLLECRAAHDRQLRGIQVPPAERLMQQWQRYSMLTPVIVSTLYVVPRMFSVRHREGESVYTEPVLEAADLLIIDEAGQVPPELAAASMALAKRAVVVGDVLQVEPVYGVTRYVDQGNLMRCGLTAGRDDYYTFNNKGVTASGGSAMRVAQRACPFWPEGEDGVRYPDRGLFLREHRRCVDEIIDYCNRLAYGGRLVPMRGSSAHPGGLPPFSFVHVDGRSVRVGSSRRNEQEARAVLEWLLVNASYLQAKYGGSALKDVVAVLTPFTAQRRFFTRLVYSDSRYAALKGVVFGTIHALQGAERDVVVFSPVYTRRDGDPGEFFFNTDVRMLNVAVSRAREAFVVIGDMEVFRKSKGPAGLLAEHLFRYGGRAEGEGDSAAADPGGAV